MLDEASIKIAVIDRLYDSGQLNDAILINEMVVANWSRRTDLTVVNGKLHAFEIKSDLDNLQRLNGQVTTYISRFDKVTVVTTPRFINAIKQIIPDEVELWEISEVNSETYIRVIKKGRTKLVTNKRILCGFLLKNELVTFLRKNDITSSLDMSRDTLIELIESLLPVKKLKIFVLNALKLRYKNTFDFFNQSRQNKTQVEDLMTLSKRNLPSKNKPLLQIDFPKVLHAEPKFNSINISSLEEKYGRFPETMSNTVLIRKVG
jgi:hypothetical protein